MGWKGQNMRVGTVATVLAWALLVPVTVFVYLSVAGESDGRLPVWPIRILSYPAESVVEFLTRRGVFVQGTVKNALLLFGILFAWWTILGAGVGTIHCAVRRRRVVRWCRRRGRCPACGYDLRGTREPRCPECGSRFDRAALQERGSE